MPKICPFGGVVKFGQIATPWIGFVDKIHGFRYIQNSMTDEYGLLKSADRGLGYAIKFDGGVALDLAYINGNGYKAPEDDSRRDVAARVTYKNSGFTLAAHGQLSGSPVNPTNNSDMKIAAYNVLVAYQADIFSVAAEAATGSKDGANLFGYSAFGNATIGEGIKVFGRYDSYDADTDTDDNTETLIIGGVEKVLAEKVKAAVNVQSAKTGTADSVNTFYLNMEVKI